MACAVRKMYVKPCVGRSNPSARGSKFFLTTGHSRARLFSEPLPALAVVIFHELSVRGLEWSAPAPQSEPARLAGAERV